MTENTRTPKRYKGRQSTLTGWARTFDKYSPTKEVNLSPIKASQANLTDQTDNPYLEMCGWTLSMSEQHFYDNAFLLLSYSKKDENKMALILHRGFIGVDMDYFNNLDEVTLLGDGGYGSVYSCRDPKTQQKFAVKYIFGAYSKFTDHFKILLTYMSERDANIRAMDSPFFAKFFSSLQVKTTGDSFLFIEFCIGDLGSFISQIQVDNPLGISNSLYENENELVQMLYQGNDHVIEICLIYIFEILCGLDFLTKCNIIHQDIKPDNVMVSSTLHLKIGDFGLAYRTRTIHRRSNRFLVNALQIDKSENENYGRSIEGTDDYQDFEIHLMYLDIDDKGALTRILRDREAFNVPKLIYDKSSLDTSFLIDTWAAGVIAVLLLFRGFMIMNPDEMPDTIFTEIPRYSLSIFLVHLIGQEDIYTKYIYDGLINAGGQEHEELMGFIASIFRPRLARCELFTKEKEIYHFSQKVKMKYVDLDKVEQLKTFSDRMFNRSSIHLREIPESVRASFPVTKAPEPKTFEQLLNEVNENRSEKAFDAKVVMLEPGVTINFFG